MKILIVECNAEELKANKTVMDCLTDALDKFTNNLCGVNFDPSTLADVMAKQTDTEETYNPYQE